VIPGGEAADLDQRRLMEIWVWSVVKHSYCNK
jgi:hypothetical protein